jgi:hypothetical protein
MNRNQLMTLVFSREEINEPTIVPSVLSNEEIPYSDILLPLNNFPIKDGIIANLAYSIRAQSFFIRIFIPDFSYNTVFFLQCESLAGAEKYLKSEKPESKKLDSIIETFEPRLFFAFHNHQLQLELIINDNQELKILKTAHNVFFVDSFFKTNPSLIFLLNLLETEKNNRYLEDLYQILKQGFLNPAREYLISNKKDLSAIPLTIRESLVAELFTKYQIAW